jgi:hypothetical protein
MSLPKNEKYEAIYYVGHVGLFEFLMSLLDLEMKGLFTEPTLRMDLGGVHCIKLVRANASANEGY